MIKNVVVVNDYDYVQGGASLVAIETANILYEKGYNVIFFCGVSNKDKSILNQNIKVIATNKFDFLSNPNRLKGIVQGVNNIDAYKKMLHLLENLNISETVVFIHGYTKALSTYFIKACRKYKVHTILTGHDYFSICPNGGLFNYKTNHICNLCGTKKCKWSNCDSRNYFFKLYRNIRFLFQEHSKFRESIDFLITISETNEQLLKPYFANSRIVRIYNPTSIDNKEDRIHCENNEYYIYVGRVDKEKGVDLLCESFKDLEEKLVIVGDGTELEYLKLKYKNSNINFVGWVTHNEALEYMKKAKALIFPSLLYEGAPLTIFEAQSLGLPVIVSKYSNGKDFITEENGWIYDPYIKNELFHILNDSNKIIKKSMHAYNDFWINPFTKVMYYTSLRQIFNNIGKKV